MNSPNLETWLNQRKAQKEKARLIEASLLSGNMMPYYFYRLRYFVLRSLVAAVIFSIEVRILLEGFGKVFFEQSLGARTLVVLLAAAWWAGLELMRSEIRFQKRSDRPYLIPRIILAWRKRSWDIAVVITAIGSGVLLILALLYPKDSVSPYSFYLFVLLLRLAVEFPLRTFHSSVYATRRIYRPLYWILFTELLSFALFLTLKPTIGAWSVGVSSLASLIASSSISYYYISKTFRYLGYKTALEDLKIKPKEPYPLSSLLNIAKQALPLTLFRMDSLIVLFFIFWGVSSQGATGQATLILLAVCTPLLYASQEWGQLLYFDYKRLELKSMELLRLRFESGLGAIILLLPLGLWLCVPLLTWLAGEGLQWAPWQLLVLLIANSYLGQQAIRVFSIGSNKELLGWGINLLLCLFALFILSPWMDLNQKLLWVSLILIGHAIGLQIFCEEKEVDSQALILPPTQWLRKLRNCKLVQGGWVKLKSPSPDEQKNSKFILREVAREIESDRGEKFYFSSLGPESLIFFLKLDDSVESIKTKEAMLMEASGKIPSIDQSIIKAAPHKIERRLLVNSPSNPEELLKVISQGEPILKGAFKPLPSPLEPPEQSIVVDLLNPEKLTLSTSDCQEIYSAALRYHRTMSTKTDRFCKKWDVVTLEACGIITTIYATKLDIPWKTRLLWKKFISHVNIKQAWTEK